MFLSENFSKHFEFLVDPRKNNHNKRHNLSDILVLVILSVICGADDWVSVEQFGKDKKDFLKKFLKLPHGIPSHDTIGDLFSRISIDEFSKCFLSWINSLIETENGDIIPIDGKTLRGSHDKKNSKAAIHMVSAWSSKNQVVLGQYKVNEKSNEITAIPELLKMLDITGCTVTIDAMGCQKKIASRIKKQGGDYLLSLKENQSIFYNAVVDVFEKKTMRAINLSEQDEQFSLSEIDENNIFSKKTETKNKTHGRIERRKCTVISATLFPKYKLKWDGLESIIMIESVRTINDKTSLEKRYYISSHLPNAEILEPTIRKHWLVENQLHWCLDVSFREDDCRVRKGNAAGNFAIVRHVALNALKSEKSSKVGIKNKRHKAGWSDEYLAKVVEVMQS
ncbi:MAG TPA: ISAs1 family transposase [Verrucomicrobiae bacterium]|nr:ISAs1 family transposase [Verrucomicrobiae bacterium]